MPRSFFSSINFGSKLKKYYGLFKAIRNPEAELNKNGPEEFLPILQAEKLDEIKMKKIKEESAKLKELNAKIRRLSNRFYYVESPEDLYSILTDEKLDEIEKLGVLKNTSVKFNDNSIIGGCLLHVCVVNNYLEIAKWLIEEKKQAFDINMEETFTAVQSGYLEMIKYIFYSAGDQKIPKVYIDDLFESAICYGYAHIVEWLVENSIVTCEDKEKALEQVLRLQKTLYGNAAGDIQKYEYLPNWNREIPTIETMIQITGLIAPESKYEYQYRCYQKELSMDPMTNGEKAAARDFLLIVESMKKTLDKAAPDENFPEDLMSKILEYSLWVKSKDLPRLEPKLEVEEKESKNSKFQSRSF